MVPLGLARGQPGFQGLASGRKRGYGGGRAGQWGRGWRGASGQLMKGPIDGWVAEWGRSGLPVVPRPTQFRGLRCSQLLGWCSRGCVNSMGAKDPTPAPFWFTGKPAARGWGLHGFPRTS